jgi:hypothetical protein
VRAHPWLHSQPRLGRPAPGGAGKQVCPSQTGGSSVGGRAGGAELHFPRRRCRSGRDEDGAKCWILHPEGRHRRYGTLVAADFSSLAAPEIMRVMREEKETRDICKR